MKLRLAAGIRLLVPLVFAATATAIAWVATSPDEAQSTTACGNGIIELAEACDDGNSVGGDGCTASCTIEQDCYDPGNTFSFFLWSDSYTSTGETGVKRVFADTVNRSRYPDRLIPRFWISTGDIPFMETSVDKLDSLNNTISNSGTVKRYPFSCTATSGRFPYFVALGNHDIDGYLTTTPESQYDYWSNYIGPRLPGSLLGMQNFQWGPSTGLDARTTYSFDYKNAHFVVVNQYFGDSTFPTPDPIACIRSQMMAWIDADLSATDKPLKFVVGHEPAWPFCSSLGGYGGSFCPSTNLDNQTPAYRPRPYSAFGSWTQPYGRHWGDSLEDNRCPAGSRLDFWSMLARHQVVAHLVGHDHTYAGRLVTGDGLRRNDVPPYTKNNTTYSTAEGVWDVTTGQVHTSSGTVYTLVTVRDQVVTFETYDQMGTTEPYNLVERWNVVVGAQPEVQITSPAAGATFVEPAAIGLAANASDADGSITRVAFNANGQQVGTAVVAPYAFTWQNVPQGTYQITAVATDNTGVTRTSTPVTVTVSSGNSAPVLAAIANRTVPENTLLSVAASATDANLPADTLTYSLVTAPAGAAIAPATGVFTWSPIESDGPGTYPVTIRVTDSAGASSQASFSITVTEVNAPPVMPAIAGQFVVEGSLLSVATGASDPDIPADTLTYSLVTAPPGAAIAQGTGVFTWTPGEADGPGVRSVTVRVTDAAGASVDATFSITVSESNAAPELAPIAAQTVVEGTALTVTAVGSDSDVPADTLTYSLASGPAGATVSPSTGTFTWTPGEADGPGAHPVTVRVTDAAGAMASATFTITVTEANIAPVLAAIASQTVVERTPLSVTAIASDADLPANTLVYSLVDAPAGATINPGSGVFTWTPGEADGPGTFTATVRVSDGAGGSAETTFSISVTESNSAPVLAAFAAQSVAEQAMLTVAASATDADLPADTLTYSLVTAPSGASIVAGTGVFTWTPGEADGPGAHDVTIRVSDSAGATAEASFTITVTEANSLPLLAAIAAQTVVEHTQVTVTASATDADLPANLLTYSLVNAPTGATINPATGVFTWTPGEADGPAAHSVTVRVSDGAGGTAETTFTITVTESNAAPVLSAIAAQTVAENTLLTVPVIATDADLPADSLTYSLVTAPTGATIVPATGVFTWTPGEADGPGTHSVTVRVVDGTGASAETTFVITVTDANSAPNPATIAAQTVVENTLLTVSAAATDADVPPDTLTYSLVTAPTGALIDPGTGVFTWTPGEADGPGLHNVTVHVTDGAGGSADTSFTITVTESNAAPALAAVAAQTVAEHTLLTVTASASDADLPADTLTYSLVSAPSGATINPGTGAFTWTPGETDGPGTHSVTVRVSDGAGGTSETTFTITVTESNAAPVLAAIAAQTVAEGSLLALTASATDADLPANTLTYSLVTAPTGATINPATGAFTWTPGEADGPGTHNAIVRVSDGNGGTAETSFAITVTESNSAPTLAAIAAQTAVENTQLTVTASATDADLPADTLTYSLVTAPAGATINPGTGVFAWTPGEADGPGTHTVTFRVSDAAGATAETSFTITVTESNSAPVLAAIATQTVAENTLLTVTSAATDADLPADTLTYSVVTAPAGATINPTTGVFVWTPGEADGPGTHNVTVRVADGNGGTAETSFTITVTESNAAPVVAAIAAQTVVENTLLTVTASATDADLPADTLTYSLVTAPTGATINAGTGVFGWTPGEADGPGTHNVIVRVSDGAGGTADTSFMITVTESNSAPSLTAIATQTVAENTLLTVTANAADADLPAETLTYSLVTAPTGATINPATGVFTWTPGEADGPGTHNVTVRVADGNGGTAETSFTITVTESNAAPVVAAIAAQTVVESTLLTVAASATDTDLPADTLTYSLVSAPSGATINPSTGVFTWTPGEADGPGTHNVTVRVSDGNGGTTETSFTITVTESNAAPSLAVIAAQTVLENTALTVTAIATDADLPTDTLTYSLVTAPAGATINPGTGVFTWTPGEADGPGSFSATIRVSDSVGATADTTFTITVTESNSAPVPGVDRRPDGRRERAADSDGECDRR